MIKLKDHQTWNIVESKPEYNSGKHLVEDKSQRTLNDLYSKLLQLGQLGQVSARQSQFHGNRQSALGIIDGGNADVSPVYMEDHDVFYHINRVNETMAKVDVMRKKKSNNEIKNQLAIEREAMKKEIEKEVKENVVQSK